jgi:hypothetical protein
MAQPTKVEYEQICALSAQSLNCPEPEDIQSINIIACDNLITCDQRQWHTDILAQAASDTIGLVGKPFTLDHNWDEVEEVQGLIYDAQLLNLTEAPPRIVQTPYAALNKKIIKAEGYRPVLVKVAFYRYSALIMQQALGALKFVSFGATSIESDLICPHDSLSFSDPECRYIPPSRLWQPSEEDLKASGLKIADYAIRTGSLWFSELSQVLGPNLPGAQVVDRSIAKYYNLPTED